MVEPNPMIQLAEQFVIAYYGALQKSKTELLAFYTDASSLTHNGTLHTGLKEIENGIESLSFKTVRKSLLVCEHLLRLLIISIPVTCKHHQSQRAFLS
jgi:hypothetical protein